MNPSNPEQILNTAAGALTAVGVFGLMTATVMLIDSLLRMVFAWNILSNERGADRICWFMVMLFPIFGVLAYFFIYQKQRDENNGMNFTPQTPKPSGPDMEWAKSVLSKNGGKI